MLIAREEKDLRAIDLNGTLEMAICYEEYDDCC